MQREELRSELINFKDWYNDYLAEDIIDEIGINEYLSQRDGTFIVDAGDNGVRMSLSKQDSGTNFVEDIEKDNEPKHLHIIPCDFCKNNRTVIDGKNYCDSCYEKRYIKRKTKPDWCEYKCECKVQYCFDPKNNKCPEDSRDKIDSDCKKCKHISLGIKKVNKDSSIIRKYFCDKDCIEPSEQMIQNNNCQEYKMHEIQRTLQEYLLCMRTDK